MSLEKGTLVKLSFTGTVKASNQIFDTTDEAKAKTSKIFSEKRAYGPLTIVVGEKQILPGVDSAIEKMKAGESKSIELEPKEAFGERDPKKVVMTPLKEFTARNMRPYPGMVIDADGSYARVRSVSGGRVNLDFNPELAGKTVIYDLKIEKILKSKDEQLLGLFEKAFPLLDSKASKIKLEKDAVVVEVGKDLRDRPANTAGKSLFSGDVLKFIDGVKTVKFVETYEKE